MVLFEKNWKLPSGFLEISISQTIKISLDCTEKRKPTEELL